MRVNNGRGRTVPLAQLRYGWHHEALSCQALLSQPFPIASRRCRGFFGRKIVCQEWAKALNRTPSAGGRSYGFGPDGAKDCGNHPWRGVPLRERAFCSGLSCTDLTRSVDGRVHQPVWWFRHDGLSPVHSGREVRVVRHVHLWMSAWSSTTDSRQYVKRGSSVEGGDA